MADRGDLGFWPQVRRTRGARGCVYSCVDGVRDLPYFEPVFRRVDRNRSVLSTDALCRSGWCTNARHDVCGLSVRAGATTARSSGPYLVLPSCVSGFVGCDSSGVTQQHSSLAVKRGYIVGFAWVALCTYGYTHFDAIQAAYNHRPVGDLPRAMSGVHLMLFGILPAWILLSGWQVSHANASQLLLRFGRRGAYVVQVAGKRILLGLLLSLAVVAGGSTALLQLGEPLTLHIGEFGYVLVATALAFAAISTVMTTISIVGRSRHRFDIWVVVVIWLGSCVVFLRASAGLAWSPIGWILPEPTDGSWSAAFASSIALILAVGTMHILDSRERARCLQR